jgi:hypothetical protein
VNFSCEIYLMSVEKKSIEYKIECRVYCVLQQEKIEVIKMKSRSMLNLTRKVIKIF